MDQITLQGVRKSFGPVNIIKNANLDIENGSFVVFVGPSGCGKTTLLRLIAGLEDVTGGQILIDGHNVVQADDLARLIADRKPGEKVTVTVLHDGKRERVEVTLGKRPDSISEG